MENTNSTYTQFIEEAEKKKFYSAIILYIANFCVVGFDHKKLHALLFKNGCATDFLRFYATSRANSKLATPLAEKILLTAFKRSLLYQKREFPNLEIIESMITSLFANHGFSGLVITSSEHDEVEELENIYNLVELFCQEFTYIFGNVITVHYSLGNKNLIIEPTCEYFNLPVSQFYAIQDMFVINPRRKVDGKIVNKHGYSHALLFERLLGNWTTFVKQKMSSANRKNRIQVTKEDLRDVLFAVYRKLVVKYSSIFPIHCFESMNFEAEFKAEWLTIKKFVAGKKSNLSKEEPAIQKDYFPITYAKITQVCINGESHEFPAGYWIGPDGKIQSLEPLGNYIGAGYLVTDLGVCIFVENRQVVTHLIPSEPGDSVVLQPGLFPSLEENKAALKLLVQFNDFKKLLSKIEVAEKNESDLEALPDLKNLQKEFKAIIDDFVTALEGVTSFDAIAERMNFIYFLVPYLDRVLIRINDHRVYLSKKKCNEKEVERLTDQMYIFAEEYGKVLITEILKKSNGAKDYSNEWSVPSIQMLLELR